MKWNNMLYVRYLSAFGQVRSGNHLGYEDYFENPGDEDTATWLSGEEALATTLGACDAKKTLETPRTPKQLELGLRALLSEQPDDSNQS